MSGDNEAKVKIVGEVDSSLSSATNEAKGSIQGLDGFVAELKASFATLGGQIDEIKAQFASFGETSQAALRGTRAATEEASGGFSGMIMRVHEGAENLRTFQARAREFAEVYASIFLIDRFKEFTKSMAESAEQIDHLHHQLGLTVSQVQGLQGVAAGSGVAMSALAKSLELMDNKAITSAGSTGAMAQAFKAMGISANDGRSNMERLMIVADKFHDLPDGPTKTAISLQLMSRGAAEMIPILDKGSQGIQALIDKTKEYGGVNAEAEEKGKALAEAVNESNIAWLGIKTTLMDALAPALTEMVQEFDGLAARMTNSYHEGGAVKQAFDSIVAAGQSIGQVLSAIAPMFEALATHIKQVTTALEALAVVMVGRYVAGVVAASIATGALSTVIFAVTAASGGAATALEALGFVAAATGRALLAAFGGPVGLAIAAVTFAVYECIDATNGAAAASQHYSDALDEERKSADADRDAIEKLAVAQGKDREEAEAAVQAHLRAAAAKLKDAESSLALAKAEAQRRLGKLQEADAAVSPVVVPAVGASAQNLPNPSMAARRAYQQQIADVQAGQQTVNGYQKSIDKLRAALAAPPPNFAGPDITPIHKQHEKKAPSRISDWEAELDQQKVAFEEMQNRQGTFFEFSKEQEAAYWAEILKRTDLSHTERVDAEKKEAELVLQIRQQAYQAHLADIKRQIEDARTSGAQRVKLAEEAERDIAQRYGTESARYKEAQAEVAKLKEENARKLIAIQTEESRTIEQLQLGEVQAALQAAQFRVSMGVETQRQLIAEEQKAEDRIFAIKAAGMRRDIAALGDSPENANKKQQLYDQLLILQQQYQLKSSKLTQQAALERTKIERQAINDFSSSWSQALGKLATLQASFASTLKSMYQGLQQAIGNALSSIIDQWLQKHLSALIIGGANSKAQAAGEIGDQAAAAYAGAYASTAAIPIVGPELAPGVAATAYGGALGALGLLSVPMFDVGTKEVSKDQFAFIHSGEAILTPSEAAGWRSVVAAASRWTVPDSYMSAGGWSLPQGLNRPLAAGFGGAASAPAGGGDVHHHTHHHLNIDRIEALDGHSVKRVLLDNASAVVEAGASGFRRGATGRRYGGGR